MWCLTGDASATNARAVEESILTAFEALQFATFIVGATASEVNFLFGLLAWLVVPIGDTFTIVNPICGYSVLMRIFSP